MYQVYLPKTNFNIYEKEYEDEILAYWEKIKLQEQRTEKRLEATQFVLHDGPPYANGPIHIGHAENKIWKDVLNRVFWSFGYNTPYILGWDAHGLPIENAVEKKLKADGIDKRALTKQEFWDECLKFATYWVEEQKKGFKKLAILGDYENPYITFKEEESIGIIETLHKFVEGEYLVNKYRPVLWSYVEKTALAYAEVEYKDKVSNSIYFSFPIIKTENELLKDVNIVIWTTTPWTLPANEAVAYNENFEYVIFQSKGKKYCVTLKLFENMQAHFEKIFVLQTIKGTEFKECIVAHCIEEYNTGEKLRRLIHGDHVDDQKGTGFVHIAPAHGEEDFELAKKEKIQIEDYLDEEGSYKEEILLVGGIHVKNAEGIILDILKKRELCIKHEEITHSYPHSWRSKAPLIYRLTKQWFLNMKPLKEKAMEVSNAANLNWFPEEGKSRFVSMLGNREDWCISRQRIWGVPIAIFYNKKTAEIIKDPTFLKKTREIIAKIGVKNWTTVEISDIDPKYKKEDWIKVEDILDIWFESGSTYSFVLKKKGLYPADIYLEGSDQHRGWFQSSMLISANIDGVAPWKNLITHGFCLDARKQKMSKSLGNVVSPLTWDIDTLRVFFSSLQLSGDVNLSENSVKQSEEMVFRFKNTIKFLLGNLGISQELESVEYEELEKIEKWVLHKVSELEASFIEITKTFYLHNFVNKLYEFCSQDLSSFYFDVRKDALYCEKYDAKERKSVITLFRILTPILIKYLSIFMPYSMEKAWKVYVEENNITIKNKESVHMQDKEIIPHYYQNKDVFQYINTIKDLKKKVNEQIEILREQKIISTSYEVKVKIKDKDINLKEAKMILIVSDVNYGEGISVKPKEGFKCKRCKFIVAAIDENLCERCVKVIKSE